MSTPAHPFGSWSVDDFWRPWLQPAPPSLVQPILPGWTLNINSHNSSAPQTEVDIVAKHSYGRQIGRMSDALRALILEQHADPSPTGPLAEFLSMWDEIEAVKHESAAARVEQITKDLALLKEQDRAAYTRLRDALRQALKQSE